MEGSEIPAVVIDNGSYSFKVGLAGEEFPQFTFRTILGKPKSSKTGNNAHEKFTCIGDHAISQAKYLKFSSPLEHGLITQWEDIQDVWEHCYYRLERKSEDLPVLMTESPLNPESDREKMTQIMFERFKVPAFYVAPQSLLILYASGRTSGVAVSSGYSVTHAVPILEGLAVSKAIKESNIGGKDLRGYMVKLLKEVEIDFCTVGEMELVDKIKGEVCYVAEDFGKELEENGNKEKRKYTLPDGQEIQIGSQQFRCPEALFQPALCGKEDLGIQDLVLEAIGQCDESIRPEMCNNIVLGGGCTNFNGIAERIKKEVSSRAPKDKNIKAFKVLAQPERELIPWIGGSILASLSNFQQVQVTKSEYEENGPVIVNKKCVR